MKVGFWYMYYFFRKIKFRLNITFLNDIESHGIMKAVWWLLQDASGHSSFCRFLRKLKSGYDYFKVGYKSGDYDYGYVLDELCWKLDRLADHLEEHDLHTNSAKYTKQIRHAVMLLRRHQEDDYYHVLMVPIEEKYGKREMFFKPREPGAKTVGCGFRWANATSEQDVAEADALHSEALRLAHEHSQRDWKAAFGILQSNMRSWWD